MRNKLVSDEFEVPLTVEHPNFIFKPLDESVAALDYEAVMSSREMLTNIFQTNDAWPAIDLSFEQNRLDLCRHWAHFLDRTAFAWTVLTPDLKRCIGCVYFYWPLLAEHDVTVYLWARSDELVNGLDKELEMAVKNWLADDWPFTNPAFPGRDIPWSEWRGGSINAPADASRESLPRLNRRD